jgi:hypothetical protein
MQSKTSINEKKLSKDKKEKIKKNTRTKTKK